MKVLSYDGRIGRLKYFTSILVASLIFYAVLFVVTFLFIQSSSPMTGMIFIWILYIVYLIMLSFVIVKRLHDLDKSGTHFWLLLIPIYNIYLSLVLLFQKGTVGPNTYGSDPIAQTVVTPMTNV